MPIIEPLTSALNFTPNSTGLSGPPSGFDGTVDDGQIERGVEPGRIVRLNCWLPVCCGEDASVTVATNVYVPATVGVPEIWPFAESVRPPGNAPPVSLQT